MCRSRATAKSHGPRCVSESSRPACVTKRSQVYLEQVFGDVPVSRQADQETEQPGIEQDMHSVEGVAVAIRTRRTSSSSQSRSMP